MDKQINQLTNQTDQLINQSLTQSIQKKMLPVLSKIDQISWNEQ